MKIQAPRLIATALAAAFLVSSVGCYPYTSDYYGPAAPNGATAYNGDAKGGYEAPEPAPPPQQPRYAGVNPGVVVAGVAAAGLLGYAIGSNHGYYPGYYGPAYYRPVPYGYYGPRYYGARYFR
ncbi:MAG: hypothetical protein V4819_12825 [Verrucomicrobiota bacterium]